MGFESLSRADQKEALRLLNQYTVSRVRTSSRKIPANTSFRLGEARFFQGLRSKLRKMLGPDFPAMAREWRVLKELRGPVGGTDAS